MSSSEYDDDSFSESGSEYNLSDVSDSESSVDSDQSISTARNWVDVDINNPSPPPPRFPFTGNPGCRFNINNVDPLAFFKLFFDLHLVNLIVSETNRYALQQPRSSRHQWEPVTVGEMYTFLAICILQGIVKKPDERMYWSTNDLFFTPIFPKLMTKNRFAEIKQNLHFADNASFDSSTHPAPKLNKILAIVNNLNSKFSRLYEPERDITVDESLLLFKGRISWRQYIPLKRSRYGVKFFMLCESSSGYLYKFIIYTGKDTILDPKYNQMQITSQIVLSLVDPLLNKGHCVTTDNYYTSPQLADYLISQQTDIYGTLRLNRRGIPDIIKRKKLKKGEIVAQQRGKVMILKWEDKKTVTLLSTVHNATLVSKQTRVGTVQMKPRVVVDYNDTMGGVDRLDQQLHDYPVARKRGKKYYKKIFFHLFDICLYNSFVLYKKYGGEKKHLAFRAQLIEQLIKEFHTVTKVYRGRPRTPGPCPLRLTERHFPAFIPPTEKKAAPTRCCAVCCNKRDAKMKKIRKETRYWCRNCDVALCPAPCFEIYHTTENI
ncbi:piggyBac transposable element-derived protein 4-like [Centruroides vittatus]|uniref:piggyBac transposable element-derived protein 4-like n=1 Tax=Centruroides vittatus TaxID=120091 RepID=UPI00350FDE6E